MKAESNGCWKWLSISLIVLPAILLGDSDRTWAAEGTVVPALTCPSCDDYNACTVDSCDTTTGTCRHDPLSCDDGNACTKDSCDAFPDPSGGCRHPYLSAGTAC